MEDHAEWLLNFDDPNSDGLRSYIWLEYCRRNDATEISEYINAKFGKRLLTPELVARYISYYSDFRRTRPDGRNEALRKLDIGARMLRSDLELAQVHYKPGADSRTQRMCAIASLQAVCSFIQGFIDTDEGRLGAPLHTLMEALYNVGTGKQPPHVILTAKVGNRPRSSYGHNWLIAVAAAALETAISEGKTPDRAADIVATELHKRGFRQAGGKAAIEAHTVKNWRANVKREV